MSSRQNGDGFMRQYTNVVGVSYAPCHPCRLLRSLAGKPALAWLHRHSHAAEACMPLRPCRVALLLIRAGGELLRSCCADASKDSYRVQTKVTWDMSKTVVVWASALGLAV